MLIRRYAYYRILWHLAFWASYVVYRSVIFGLLNRSIQRSFIISIIELPSYLLVTYLVLYWAIPRFLKVAQYNWFLATMLGIVVLGGISNYLMRYIFQFLYVEKPAPFIEDNAFFLLCWCIFYTTLAASVAISAKLIKDWYVDQQIQKRLIQEKVAAELKFLKAQINPHFLFNTLNNLYGLTLKNSSRAPEVVMRLSQLMHYMTYDSNQDRVPLEKEIEHLRNYIELERLRYGDKLKLNFIISGDLQHRYIAPLLILPFVENAFKHGASELTDEAWMNLKLMVSENKMTFEIANNKQPFAIKKRNDVGIGMKNVLKRLDLIYPNQYDLQIQEEDTVFTIRLSINVFSLAQVGKQ